MPHLEAIHCKFYVDEKSMVWFLYICNLITSTSTGMYQLAKCPGLDQDKNTIWLYLETLLNLNKISSLTLLELLSYKFKIEEFQVYLSLTNRKVILPKFHIGKCPLL